MKKKLTFVAFIFTSLFVIAGMSVVVTNFKKGDFSRGIVGIFLVVGISFLDYKLWNSIHINQTNIDSSSRSWFKRINFPIVLAVLLVLGLVSGNNERKEENPSQATRNNVVKNDKKEQKKEDTKEEKKEKENKKEDKKEDKKEEKKDKENKKEHKKEDKKEEKKENKKEDKKEEQLPTCDGISITSNCLVDGITYSKYIYHPAKEAVTHVENVQTGTETRTSSPYILCNDGFHWGSMTHRGACSGHNGVADFEHVDTYEIPVYQEQIVEDSPAQDEYYEKEEKQKDQ